MNVTWGYFALCFDELVLGETVTDAEFRARYQAPEALRFRDRARTHFGKAQSEAGASTKALALIGGESLKNHVGKA